jgi:hypothetical protein
VSALGLFIRGLRFRDALLELHPCLLRGSAARAHRVRNLASLDIHRLPGGVDPVLDSRPGLVDSLRDAVRNLGYEILRLVANPARTALEVASRFLTCAWREEKRDPGSNRKSEHERAYTGFATLDYDVRPFIIIPVVFRHFQ